MARVLCDGVFEHELVGYTGLEPGHCKHCGRSGPRQLGARMLELTPELYAHYGPWPPLGAEHDEVAP
jgi:hypothetical protein